MPDETVVDEVAGTLDPTADDYYAQGVALVTEADRLWAEAHDPARAEDFRRVSMHAYEITAARARTRFRRHDVRLDQLQRTRGGAT